MIDARRMVRQQFGRDHHPALRKLAQALTMTVWPLAVMVHLWQERRLSAPEEMPIRRAPGAIWAAIRHNILPGEYYAYALWQPERRMYIDNYLYSHEAARIFKFLNRKLRVDPIGDKLAFHEMCIANALPTPPILAAFAPAGKLLDFPSGQPPECDLFVKPRVGLAGHGAERFRWCEGAFESECGCRMRPQDLIDHLLARARREKRTLLVQPNLSNHPALRVKTNGALATARLVTGYSADDVVVIFGFIYFGRSDRIIAQHGHVALIEVATGRLVPAHVWGTNANANSSNPQAADRSDAGALQGQYPTPILPDWHAAVQHVKSAHRACCNIAFVGWDIGFTHQGPMLLEGNANWSADEYQSLSGKPLGHTEFAPLLATRLKDCHFA
jgi:hypothetical protein